MRFFVIAALAVLAAGSPRLAQADSGCSQASVNAAQKALDAVQSSYGVGLASKIDLLTAQSHALDAKNCAAKPNDDFRFDYFAAKVPVVKELLAMKQSLYENGVIDRVSVDEYKAQIGGLSAACDLRQKQAEALANNGFVSLSTLQKLTAACADLKALQ